MKKELVIWQSRDGEREKDKINKLVKTRKNEKIAISKILMSIKKNSIQTNLRELL